MRYVLYTEANNSGYYIGEFSRLGGRLRFLVAHYSQIQKGKFSLQNKITWQTAAANLSLLSSVLLFFSCLFMADLPTVRPPPRLVWTQILSYDVWEYYESEKEEGFRWERPVDWKTMAEYQLPIHFARPVAGLYPRRESSLSSARDTRQNCLPRDISVLYPYFIPVKYN